MMSTPVTTPIVSQARVVRLWPIPMQIATIPSSAAVPVT